MAVTVLGIGLIKMGLHSMKLLTKVILSFVNPK